MTVSNTTSVPVSVFSEDFEFSSDAPTSKRGSVMKDGIHRPAFLVQHRSVPKIPNDQYSLRCILGPGESIVAWVDFDETIGEAKLETMRHAKKLGKWKYRYVWHEAAPTAYTYEREL
jgi:hypothetical protein